MILLMDGVVLMIVLAMLLPILSSATWTPLEIKGLQVLFSDR